MNKRPSLIKGAVHNDARGSLFYNNNFDAAVLKRIYCIENTTTEICRAWQGHQIEQRWFSAIEGRFQILLIQVDNWVQPTKSLIPQEFILKSTTLDVLHIPNGYISSIRALENKSKLLVMADYFLGEIDDEYKFPQEYFKNK